MVAYICYTKELKNWYWFSSWYENCFKYGQWPRKCLIKCLFYNFCHCFSRIGVKEPLFNKRITSEYFFFYIERHLNTGNIKLDKMSDLLLYNHFDLHSFNFGHCLWFPVILSSAARLIYFDQTLNINVLFYLRP